MKNKKKRLSMHILQAMLLPTMITGISATAYASRQQVEPAYGYYKIAATNGHGKDQELYYDSKASKKDLKWKDDGTIWYIGKGDYDHSYYIGLADDPSYMVGINDTYIGNDKPLKVIQNNYNHVIFFYNENGSDPYNNLTITLYDWAGFSYNYKLNRHKSMGNDYVNLRSDSDTNNKLWKLVPVTYTKSIKKAAPSLTAEKEGTIRINWDKLRKKIKSTKVWKNAKYIEIQYSTDKEFRKNVKTKKIRKGTVNKAKAKSTLSKLKRKKTYYIRARLIDQKGVYSNWSKTVKVKTK